MGHEPLSLDCSWPYIYKFELQIKFHSGRNIAHPILQLELMLIFCHGLYVKFRNVKCFVFTKSVMWMIFQNPSYQEPSNYDSLYLMWIPTLICGDSLMTRHMSSQCSWHWRSFLEKFEKLIYFGALTSSSISQALDCEGGLWIETLEPLKNGFHMSSQIVNLEWKEALNITLHIDHFA